MPAVARKDGTDSISTQQDHGCDIAPVTDEGSSDVFVNGKGVVRLGDLQHIHNIQAGNSCVPHVLALSSSSSTVFVNGKGAGRKGDVYGNETIATGSDNVFFGD